MTGNRLATPEDAYFEFFRADSAKDAQAWAAAMGYPHVRVSATGRVAYHETAEDYAARASWGAREATGWVRSRGIEPARLHEAEDKVHLAGGWTRFNADDEPILRNRVTLHRHSGRGFLGDSGALRHRLVHRGRNGRCDGCGCGGSGSICRTSPRGMWIPLARRSPCRFVDVGIGRVERHESPAGLRPMLLALIRPHAIERVEAAQAGRDGVVVSAAWRGKDGRGSSGVFLVARRESRRQIVATSTMAA